TTAMRFCARKSWIATPVLMATRPPVRSSAEQRAHDEYDVLAPLAQAPVEIGQPVRPVRDVHAHRVARVDQGVPCVGAQPQQHLQLEAIAADAACVGELE